MKRSTSVLIALGMMAAMLVALAAPALADDGDFFDRFNNDFEDCFEVDGLLICDEDRDFFDNDEDCFVVDGLLVCDEDRDFFDGDRFDLDGFDGDFAQEVEQDAESGDVDQSFDVSQTGDNSNQCVSTQGVANTGNTQNSVGLGLLGGDFDDLEIEDSGSSIEVSPTNTMDCTSEVNQAASASG
jgi:hypothetical protein